MRAEHLFSTCGLIKQSRAGQDDFSSRIWREVSTIKMTERFTKNQKWAEKAFTKRGFWVHLRIRVLDLRGEHCYGNYYWDSASRLSPDQQEAIPMISQGPHHSGLEVSSSPRELQGWWFRHWWTLNICDFLVCLMPDSLWSANKSPLCTAWPLHFKGRNRNQPMGEKMTLGFWVGAWANKRVPLKKNLPFASHLPLTWSWIINHNFYPFPIS